MRDIKELKLAELEGILSGWKEPVFHRRQIWEWIYKKGATDFSLMSNLSQGLRKKLKDNFYILGLKLAQEARSFDGTQKFLLETQDKKFIECVNIPANDRLTGCISSQVGCKYACRFCASGLLGFKRNLSIGEMLDQVLYLKNNSGGALSHIVFMGVGEPLDNYDNVLSAVRIINSREAFNIGARRITISTCGIIPGIERLAQENLQIELSISLHAADDKLRSKIMPVNKKYPLKELLRACSDYIKKTNRQITLEYVLIKGLNSDLPSAKNLVRIAHELGLAKVNLIAANPVKELGIAPSNKLGALFFKNSLLKNKVNATFRKSRGQDIQAACGQLRLKYENN